MFPSLNESLQIYMQLEEGKFAIKVGADHTATFAGASFYQKASDVFNTESNSKPDAKFQFDQELLKKQLDDWAVEEDLANG